MSAERREVIAVISADASKLDPGLAKGKRKVRRWGKEITVELKRGIGSIGSIIGLGGMAGVLAAGKKVHEFQKRLVRLRINGEASASTIKNLEQQIFKVARARGLDPDQLLGAAEKYTSRTGDLKTFMEGMDKLGMVAAATGTEMDDVSAVAAAMQQQLGINPDEWELAFDVLVRGGKAGAVELSNLAGELVGLLPMFKRFGDGGTDALAEISALLQMTQTGFDTAGEAATGLQSLMGSIVKSAKKLKGGGIDIFKPGSKTQLRSLWEIVQMLHKKTGGNVVKLGKLLGTDKESTKAFLAIIDQGVDKFEDLADQQKAAGGIRSDYKIYEESDAKKMASAFARLDQVLNDKIAKHLGTAASAMEKFAGAIELAANNWQLLVAALGGKKLLDILTDGGGFGGGGGGGRGGKGRGRGKGKGGGMDKGDAAAASVFAFGSGYAVGDWINEKLGLVDEDGEGKLGKALASSGVGAKATNVVDNALLGDMRLDAALRQARQETGMQFGPAVALRQQQLLDDEGFARNLRGGPSFNETFGLTREIGKGEREKKRAEMAAAMTAADEAMLMAMQQAGVSQSDLPSDAYQNLRAGTASTLLQQGGLGLGADGAGAALVPDLVRELRRLTLALQQQGGDMRITVEEDGRGRRRGG